MKKRYFAIPLMVLLLGSPLNPARYNLVKASYLENVVENFSSFIANRPTEIEEVFVYGKSPTLEEIAKRNKERLLYQKHLEQNSEKINPPIYRLNSDHCSEYALLAARKLFGKEYNWRNTWDLRYKNQVVSEIKNNENILELIINNKLKPGMIVGTKIPNSNYENEIDLEGNKAKYTHVLVYVGINQDNEPEFIHQLGSRIMKSSLLELEKKKFIPKEIIGFKN